ncbi:hypothetical protein LINPERPRIM_LOCUS11230, partial [Linum perenne]
ATNRLKVDWTLGARFRLLNLNRTWSAFRDLDKGDGYVWGRISTPTAPDKPATKP